MIWIAPSEKDTATTTLEKRLWDDAETYRSISEIAEELWGKGGLEEQAQKTERALKGILQKVGITA